MIKIIQKKLKDKIISELQDFKLGSWIYVEDPSENEVDILQKEQGIDPGMILDALDPDEVPRIEIENGITYIYTRVPVKQGTDIDTIPILIALTKNSILTVSKIHHTFFDDFLSGEKEYITTQKLKMIILFFSEIFGVYKKRLNQIRKSVKSMSVKMEKIQNKNIKEFVFYERILNDFINVLIPTNIILENIIADKRFPLFEEDEDIVEDMFLSNKQLIEACKANLKNIVNVREAYSTIMSNNLNKTMKMLTALTVVLTIPTMISSFYGMNISLPFADSNIAYLWVLLISVLLSSLILVIFFYNDWI